MIKKYVTENLVCRRKLLITAPLLFCFSGSSSAWVDPRKAASKSKDLMEVSFDRLSLDNEGYQIGKEVGFSVTLEMSDDGGESEGYILTYIDSGSGIEASKLLGRFKFPNADPNPLTSRGPAPRRSGLKRFVILSADTYASATFTVG